MTGETMPEAAKTATPKAELDKAGEEIIHDIILAKTELETATQNYNFADSDDLIDIYAYRIIAAQTKYNMLIKKAREKGLSYNEYLSGGITSVRK
ncbi:MAG: hypothetical protein BWY15_01023 [Firmicutes bacterium ADurb.Bin193]|nr:MAG: hypothetical protein BWY15_01023 [Firmicutes bacterium ADurb.Bin193]